MQAALETRIGGTYSARTLIREYTKVSTSRFGADDVQLYWSNDRIQAVVCKPSSHRKNRFDIVADAYLDEQQQEVVRLYSDDSLGEQVLPALQASFEEMISKPKASVAG